MVDNLLSQVISALRKFFVGNDYPSFLNEQLYDGIDLFFSYVPRIVAGSHTGKGQSATNIGGNCIQMATAFLEPRFLKRSGMDGKKYEDVLEVFRKSGQVAPEIALPVLPQIRACRITALGSSEFCFATCILIHITFL
jgi:hypothetical protein